MNENLTRGTLVKICPTEYKIITGQTRTINYIPSWHIDNFGRATYQDFNLHVSNLIGIAIFPTKMKVDGTDVWQVLTTYCSKLKVVFLNSKNLKNLSKI